MSNKPEIIPKKVLEMAETIRKFRQGECGIFEHAMLYNKRQSGLTWATCLANETEDIEAEPLKELPPST